MNKMYLMGCIGILAASAMLSSCSSDDEGNGGSTTEYKWTTNGGLKACDHILFETDNKENANGTQIGNGDQEFFFHSLHSILGFPHYLLNDFLKNLSPLRFALCRKALWI